MMDSWELKRRIDLYRPEAFDPDRVPVPACVEANLYRIAGARWAGYGRMMRYGDEPFLLDPDGFPDGYGDMDRAVLYEQSEGVRRDARLLSYLGYGFYIGGESAGREELRAALAQGWHLEWSRRVRAAGWTFAPMNAVLPDGRGTSAALMPWDCLPDAERMFGVFWPYDERSDGLCSAQGHWIDQVGYQIDAFFAVPGMAVRRLPVV